MQCHDICENLSAYIDGILEQQVASLVEQHLKSCPECRMEYEDLLATVELVRELPEVEPLPDFRDDLRKRLLAGITAGDVRGAPKPAARRLFGKRWVGLVAAAAVIFLTMGVTALWYDDQGLLPFPGKDKAAEESQVAQNEADNPADNIMALRASDGDNESRMSSAPAPDDAPQAAIQKSNGAPLELQFQSPSGIAGDGTEDLTGTDSSRQPGLEEDTGFSIMAVPDNKNEESHQFIPALTKEEKAKRDAAPPGLGGGPSQAVEYSVTLQVYDRQEAILQVNEVVENYGGFIEPQQGQADNYLLIKVPFYNTQTLIEEIGQVGTITDQQSKQRDLTPEIQQIEKNIDELEVRESVLAEQLANQTNPETVAKELAKVREQIAGQQAELDLVITSMMMNTVELVLNDI